MTVYIQKFQFKKYRKFRSVDFEYFTGYKWKHLSIVDPFETKQENVACYTRLIMDAVVSDICGKCTDTLKRNDLIRQYDADIECIARLNSETIKCAVKLFC